MKTTSDNLTFSLAVVLSLWVILAGGYLCYANPDDPWRYLFAMAIVCFAWTIRYAFRGKAETSPACLVAQRKVTQTIVLAGVILGLAFISRLGWLDGLGDVGERTRGFITGTIVVFLANAIPKQAGPARGYAMRRAAGWAMVLGGLGYALAWLLLPVAYANEAAMSAMLLALAYTIARFMWFVRECRSNRPTGAG